MIKPTLREAVDWLMEMPRKELSATYLSVRWERQWRLANNIEGPMARTDNPFVAVLARLDDAGWKALKTKIRDDREAKRKANTVHWRMSKKDRRRLYMREYRRREKEKTAATGEPT